ncbi:MAG: aminopeptidase P family protein [Planctomycetes bacterium]|nr:aminopeptidase P family protein [Planctomycetota bacterium]
MFPRGIYIHRREQLKRRMESGLILLSGNEESPRNFAANPYPFRQDSTFLYYFGLDRPGLAAVMDLDEGTECLFGDDPTLDEIVWTGPQPLLRDLSEQIGVTQTAPSEQLEQVLRQAVRQGRTIHTLPPYRPGHCRGEGILPLRVAGILPAVRGRPRRGAPLHVGLDTEDKGGTPSPRQSGCIGPSEPLIRAIVAQRSIKSPEEIEQIEAALEITHRMQTTAMQLARPGVFEYEVAGAMEGIALSSGGRLAYPSIFSIRGEIMHNPHYGNRLKAGDIAVNDSGAESALHYASDLTRTIPVGGRFSSRQKEIYSIVLTAQEKAIAAAAPGVEWREVHRLAAVLLMEGLKELGLVMGDPQEAVAAGAHTLFFPCGVGHMLGLDVHDMEPLGEDYVGYTDTIQRNPEFGWRSLRLAKPVEPGFVVTVEPGIYFMPELIDRWQAEGRHRQFIDYGKLETYRHFGGIRIEDDILITPDGCRVLGPHIPKAIAEVEALTA